MAAITGAQLVGDTFQADQGSQGSIVANSNGTYTFTSNGSLNGLGDSITVSSSDPSPSENFMATVNGGTFNGIKIPATILANDSGDVLAQATINGSTYYIYETNDPASQPAQGSSVTIGAIGPNNPYSYQTVCFAAGTRVRTARGDIAVEHLEVDDLVVTASGALRPIRWLGHRTIDCARHPRRAEVLPVCIAAEAFGPRQPARDLLVSPGHAICVDVLGGVLIPAGALVGCPSVARVEVERVTYWHVELGGHDILLAENLACESYLEMGNRGFFIETEAVALAAGPDAPVRTHADFCRPFHGAGPLVEAVRGRLAARAVAARHANKRAGAA